MLKLPLPCLLVVFYYLSLIAMAEVNVTVDDTHSSISYHPLRFWSARVSHCRTTDGAYNCTWHEPVSDAGSENAEVGRPISMSVNFIGTALYLYSPPGCSPSPSGLTYNLDGQAVSSLSTHSTDSPVFAYWNLPNASHNLIVEVDRASTFPFDYLIYTTATEPIPSMLVQARQAAGDNSTISSSSDSSSTSTPPPPNNDTKTQIGAIAYAVAASVGITSLFSIGLAISIIKIRRQRHRVRRERRDHDRNRSRGLAIHLPPASVSSSTPQRPTQLPRYTADTSASVEPPSYDAVMRPTGGNSITPGQTTYVTRPHLTTISEVATMSQPSISSRRDPSTVREDSLAEMPPSPPGLGEQQPPPTIENLVESQNQSSTSQHSGVRSDHDA